MGALQGAQCTKQFQRKAKHTCWRSSRTNKLLWKVPFSWGSLKKAVSCKSTRHAAWAATTTSRKVCAEKPPRINL